MSKLLVDFTSGIGLGYEHEAVAGHQPALARRSPTYKSVRIIRRQTGVLANPCPRVDHSIGQPHSFSAAFPLLIHASASDIARSPANVACMIARTSLSVTGKSTLG